MDRIRTLAHVQGPLHLLYSQHTWNGDYTDEGCWYLSLISQPVLLANFLHLFGHCGSYDHLHFHFLVSCSDTGVIATVRVLVHESILLSMTCSHRLSPACHSRFGTNVLLGHTLPPAPQFFVLLERIPLRMESCSSVRGTVPNGAIEC